VKVKEKALSNRRRSWDDDDDDKLITLRVLENFIASIARCRCWSLACEIEFDANSQGSFLMLHRHVAKGMQRDPKVMENFASI
jgi:hypothetical protein